MKPVELRDVMVRRGAFRLDIPSLVLESGLVVGLVGRNGSGKSTLLELLVGLLAPDRGTVSVFGIDPLVDPVGARRRVGLMTEDMPLFNLTVGAHMRAIAPFYPAWDEGLAAHLLQHFELAAGKRISQASKGEGTRIRLALTLAWKPDLVLLDEPATGLDVPSRRQMLKEVVGIVRDPNRTVIVSSHDVADIERIADYLVVLEAGRVVAAGTPPDVLGEGRTLEEMLAGEKAR
jgi:ABC-2 type transport system ATP-binding protein